MLKPWAFSCALCAACGGSEPHAACVRAAITGGSAHAEYLALHDSQELSIVQIHLLADDGVPFGSCSGTLVAPGVVLTASHCFPVERAVLSSVSFYDHGHEGPTSSPVAVMSRHPRLDLALLSVAAVPSSAAPIPLNAGGDVVVGGRVQISGFGRTAQATIGERQFAVATIRELEAESFVVSADRRAGACDGDSGGPALIRDARGRVAVAGVLTAGAASCGATDRYITVGAEAAWFEANGVSLSGSQLGAADCASLGAEGRCFGQVAVWCEGDGVHSQVCSACGFAAAARGFRCVALADDACDGVDSFGECRESERLRCASGKLERDRCSECGATCVISRRTGQAICNAEE